jgi:hypothetical protein
VLLPSSNVVSHSAGSRSGSKLSLGPFSSIPAFKLETFKAHFEHPGQFKRVSGTPFQASSVQHAVQAGKDVPAPKGGKGAQQIRSGQ